MALQGPFPFKASDKSLKWFGWFYHLPVACANILILILCPNHDDMLRAWVNYEAVRSFNQKNLSLVLF